MRVSINLALGAIIATSSLAYSMDSVPSNEFRLPDLQEKLLDRLPERLGDCEFNTLEGRRYLSFEVKKGDIGTKLNFDRKDRPTGLRQIDYLYSEPYYNYGRGDEVEDARKYHHYSSETDSNENEIVEIHAYTGTDSSGVWPSLSKLHYEATFDTEGHLINFKTYLKSTTVVVRPRPEFLWNKVEDIECSAE